MDIQQEDRIISVHGFKVPLSTLNKIKRLIEYYFSMANLVADEPLREIIQSNNRGWAPVLYLAQYNDLKTIIFQQFQGKLIGGKIARIVDKALQSSTYVKSAYDRVKLRKHLVWKRSMRRLLYFQSTVVTLEDICRLLMERQNVLADDIMTNKGNNWFMIDFYQKQPQYVQKICTAIEKMIENKEIIGLRLMKRQQFINFSQQCDKIWLKMKEKPKIKYRYRIIPRQLMDYDDTQRQKYIKEDNGENDNKKHGLPIRYVQTRNPQAKQNYERLRTKRIEQWRLRKLARQQMKIQQQMREQQHNVEKMLQQKAQLD